MVAGTNVVNSSRKRNIAGRYFAGKLIEDAGLRGYRVGDAQVSEKHCGFVINRGNATAAEVAQLMEDVADRVEEKFGVRLQPEVKKIGEF